MAEQVMRVDGWEITPVVMRGKGPRFRVRGPGWRRHEYLTLAELKRELGPELLARLRLDE